MGVGCTFIHKGVTLYYFMKNLISLIHSDYTVFHTFHRKILVIKYVLYFAKLKTGRLIFNTNFSMLVYKGCTCGSVAQVNWQILL